jgi:hypothetical protein
MRGRKPGSGGTNLGVNLGATPRRVIFGPNPTANLVSQSKETDGNDAESDGG